MMRTRSDKELIEIIMNCKLDADKRKHAAKELMRRLNDEEI